MLTIHTRALVDPLTVQKLSARLIFQLKFLIFNLNSLRSTLILYIHSIAAQVSRNCQRPPQKVTGSLDSTKLDYPGMFSTYIYYFQLKFVIFNLNPKHIINHHVVPHKRFTFTPVHCWTLQTVQKLTTR